MLSFEKHDVAMIVYKGQAWFRASDVTTVLEYKKSATSVRSHVNAKYVRTLTELQLEASGPNAPNPGIHFERSGKPPLYINESGIYELVWQSKKKKHCVSEHGFLRKLYQKFVKPAALYKMSRFPLCVKKICITK